MALDQIQLNLLKEVANIHEVPEGAYSLRINGQLHGKNSSENIVIEKKDDKPGIDIYIKDGTRNESLHIPVILSQSGLKELVYNDFHIGKDCDVTIVAGCGIHNAGDKATEHSGIHSFFVGENSKVKYIEKHYGDGDGSGENVMNPTTVVVCEKNSYMEMETAQIKGVDSTDRSTKATLAEGSTLIVREKIMTHGKQFAKTNFDIELCGEGCHAHAMSRSVAKDESYQEFTSMVRGNGQCSGRTECDAIIMDKARVVAIPQIEANHPDAQLVHEAAIGKIAGEQLVKLMSLGLSEKKAEEVIINGFLK